MWHDAFIDVKVDQFVGIMPEDFVEHGCVFLKNIVKLFSLVSCEMCTILCDCANVSWAIICCQDAWFRALCECQRVTRGGRMGRRVDGVEL